MMPEYSSPFFQAVQEVFKMMLNLEVMRCPVNHEPTGVNGKEIQASIGLTGDVTGTVRFHFPEGTSLEIVKLMCGMEMDKLDTFVTSAMAEMSNIISGNAVSNLARQSLTCDILPPQININENEFAAANPESRLVLETSAGKIMVDILLTSKQ